MDVLRHVGSLSGRSGAFSPQWPDDHDTSVFAVTTIETWWRQMGQQKYPNAR
jgi:hypothetical protein